MHRIYLDYNSTTPLDAEVRAAMLPYLGEQFGNPSNLHYFGRETREAIEQARDKVAAYLNASPDEIFFTSGGTEADNWAIKGVAAALQHKGRHIICSPIEHGAVLSTCRYLAEHGYELSQPAVDGYGLVDPDSIKSLLRKDTILVSIMLANNEIGTIQPVAEIARVCHDNGVLLHTDAVAAGGKEDLDIRRLDVDLLTLSAHKMHGPKGVGCLYVRHGTPIHPLLHGGHQEHGLRGGTENPAGIAGFGKACEIARSNWRAETVRLRELRDLLERLILERIEEVRVNGHPTKRLANTLHLSIGYIEGEALLVNLDLEGIAVASGSACASGEAEPSPTLKAICVPPQFINSPLRFSLGKENTQQEIVRTAEVLEMIVRRLRNISPVWQDRGRKFFAGAQP